MDKLTIEDAQDWLDNRGYEGEEADFIRAFISVMQENKRLHILLAGYGAMFIDKVMNETVHPEAVTSDKPSANEDHTT